MFHVPNKHRIRTGPYGSDESYGNSGAFAIKQKKNKPTLNIIASDQDGWEHVSVSTQTRTPSWKEMCMIKDMFWDDCDCVVQYHPPRDSYVNNHPFCLHMWRPTDKYIPMPPTVMISIQGEE